MECDGRQGQPAPGEVHDLPRRAPLDRHAVDPHQRRRDDEVAAAWIDAGVVAHVVATHVDQALVAQVGAERPHAGPVPGAGDQVPGVRAEHQPRHRPLRVRPQDVGVRKRERPEVRTAQPATREPPPVGAEGQLPPVRNVAPQEDAVAAPPGGSPGPRPEGPLRRWTRPGAPRSRRRPASRTARRERPSTSAPPSRTQRPRSSPRRSRRWTQGGRRPGRTSLPSAAHCAVRRGSPCHRATRGRADTGRPPSRTP